MKVNLRDYRPSLRTCAKTASRAAIGCAVLLGALAVGAPAHAVLIGITSGSYTLGSGWGSNPDDLTNWNLLNVDWAVDAGLAGTSFDLDFVGETHTVVFGSAFIDEEDAWICDGGVTPGGKNCDGADTNETDNLEITAVLNLSDPIDSGENVVGTAIAFGGTMNDSHADLTVTFDFDPHIVLFGTGGSFRIELLNSDTAGATSTFSFFHDEDILPIYAKFTLLSLPTTDTSPPDATQIPEPSSLTLFAFGIGAIGFLMRRRKKFP